MPEPDQLVILRSSGEWSALYVNGVLDRVGDHYVAEERVYELTGVTIEYTEDFMRGNDRREDVAQTLDEVQAYRTLRENMEAEAARMVVEARSLLERAFTLDPSKTPTELKIGNKKAR